MLNNTHKIKDFKLQELPQLEISMREKSHLKIFNEIFSNSMKFFGKQKIILRNIKFENGHLL